MILYFEFEDRRVKANVDWPKSDEPIAVHLTDAAMVREFPTDLFFDVEAPRKVVFTIEDKDNERLIELQSVLARRLQEFVTKE
ncbi:hypothetical protein [Aridibaculum aurantiacum]|uniref:hypothetical protein n=1 Tax=Aridibaculum aurantiacum TaxID=2810307 RepID=UPI001A964567|nr:hypothetical protein [Aridibaculum aurantiacum]